MAKKSFQDIKVPKISPKMKIPMEVYAPIPVEKKQQNEIKNKSIDNYSPDLFINKNKTIKYKENDFSSFYPEKENNNNHRYTIWVIAFISVVFLFFAISLFFSKATITINPKIKQISLNQNFSALKETNTNGISFDLMSLSDQESISLQGGEEKEVKENAKGKVLLYNNYSTESQPLLIDTRLEGSNGKIYKTKTKIIIPGKSKDGNPGKASVEIYAENPGPEYNSDPLDFKIFGFKNSVKYSKFYGRSVGNITGGYIGKSRQVSETDKDKAKNTLKTNLETKLFNKALSQIPEGYILYKNATNLTIDEETFSSPDSEGKVTLNIKGTLKGIVINENKLANKIIASILPDNKEDIYISNLKDLTLVLSNKNILDFASVSNIDFNIYGVPKVVYKVDEKKIIGDLSGVRKKEFKKILANYEYIELAEMSMNPIWKSTFPENYNKFKIIVKYPEKN